MWIHIILSRISAAYCIIVFAVIAIAAKDTAHIAKPAPVRLILINKYTGINTTDEICMVDARNISAAYDKSPRHPFFFANSNAIRHMHIAKHWRYAAL